MTDPIALGVRTPRHSLPLLYPGQAQKEVFVNEALARPRGDMEAPYDGVIELWWATDEDADAGTNAAANGERSPHFSTAANPPVVAAASVARVCHPAAAVVSAVRAGPKAGLTMRLAASARATVRP